MIPTDPNNAVSCDNGYESSSEEELIEGTAGPHVGSAVSINYKKIKSLRNARELALFAEKKWILKTLSSIRKQRNALKVESLYYHGLKANLFANHAAQFGGQSLEPTPEPPTEDSEIDPVPEENYFEIEMEPHPLTVEPLPPSNIEDFNIMEEQCNEQELKNLNMVVEKKPEKWEDDYQEYESDEEPWQQVNLDMGMLVGMDEEPDDFIETKKRGRR